MEDKCPLCLGKVVDGRCTGCGYDIPDQEELESLSSIYNYEPAKQQVNAEVGYADPYMPSVQQYPNIEVVEDQKWENYNPQKAHWQPPAQQNQNQQNFNPNQQANNTQNQQNPYQQQYYQQNQNQQANQQNPYQQQYYQQNQNQQQYYPQNQVQPNNQLQSSQWQNGVNQNYTNNNVPFSPYTQSGAGNNSGKSAFARRWWMFLLALLLPLPVGLVFFAVLLKSNDPDEKKLAFPILGVAVLRLIIGLASMTS